MFQSKILPALFLLTCAFAAQAEIKLTQADLIGTWQIDAEAISLDGRGRKELNSTWTFKQDGTMEGLSADTNQHARLSQFRASLNYSVVDGKIEKQVSPGRSKMQTCAAIEKTGKTMVLECDSIFFFMTKK